jgi:hypothetical protein
MEWGGVQEGERGWEERKAWVKREGIMRGGVGRVDG